MPEFKNELKQAKAKNMTRRGKKEGEGDIGPDEKALWRAYTEDIVPLHVEWPAPEPPAQERPPSPDRARQTGPRPRSPEAPVRQPPQLDRGTEQKLKRGQFEIEARLDLHGLTEERAHQRLNAFVQQAYRAQYRCILVITGKGLRKSEGRESGILRRQLPLWLSLPPYSGMVLKLQTAAPKDGGSGAFYLYLKRQRAL